MNKEELIHEYLDGSLDDSSQELLFAELSGNSDYRHKFNEYIELKVAAVESASGILPPSGLSASVFSGLGYDIPGEYAPLSKPVISQATKTFKPLKIMSYALTSILSAIIVYLFLSDSITANKQFDTAVASGSALYGRSLNYPFTANYEAPSEKIIIKEIVRVPVNVENNLKPPALQDKNPEKADAYFFSIDKTNLNNKEIIFEDIRNLEPAITSPIANQPLFFDIEEAGTLPRNIMVQFNLAEIESSPKVNLASGEATHFYDDKSIAALYKYNNEHYFGIELGSESFGQVFRAEIDGRQAEIRQKPMIWWGGATYMYSPEFLNIEDIIRPFGQCTFAKSNVGWLGKARLGINYLPRSIISAHLYLEGAGMIYSSDNKLFSTEKLGISGGVSFNF